MEALGTARLAEEIPAERAITTVISRHEVAEALQDPERTPELYLDLERGDERSTVGISWSYGELAHLFEDARGDDIVFTFDADELQWAFDDVEAHGLREKALVFAVAAAGALGSGATIANAAPTIERDSGGAASVATVQALATDSSGFTSNARTPGLQTGDEGSGAAAASIKLSTEPRPAVADDGIVSNVHTPGLQIGPGESTAATPSVSVSAGSSDGEFLGVDTRDVTEALVVGGVLLAIAGATFAGTRRPGSTRPA